MPRVHRLTDLGESLGLDSGTEDGEHRGAVEAESTLELWIEEVIDIGPGGETSDPIPYGS